MISVNIILGNNKQYIISNPHKDVINYLNLNKIHFDKDSNYKDIIISIDNSTYKKIVQENKELIIKLYEENDENRDLEGYQSYHEVLSHLQNIADENSDFVTLQSLGPSTANIYYQLGMDDYIDYQHEIWLIKLSDNPNIEEDEPNVLYCGVIHPKETISLPVPMKVLDYLVDNYGSDPDVTNWINTTQIWFIPIMNPDGYHAVYEGIYSYHRKNLRDNNENQQPDYSYPRDGVDLNRNFGYVWGNNGASSTPSSDQYHGPYEFSEIESRYVRDLIRARKFFGSITYHSYGENVLYPLGHLNEACSYDHEIMGDLAEAMALTIPIQYGTGHYDASQASDFYYTCQGTMGDWGYAEQRIFSFTIELAREFNPDSIYIEPICEANLDAALIFLDRVHHSTVTGNITNTNGEPLVAEVNVTEIDEAEDMSSVEPVRSDSLFGRYYRPLLPGSYTFTFSCEGYLDANFNNIGVSSNTNTVLDVVLGYTYVDSISLFIENEIVSLEWILEDGYEYHVHSSDDPNGVFQEDFEGEYLELNRWEKIISRDKEFYRVLKIPQ